MDWEDFYTRTATEALPWNAQKPDSDLVRLVESGEIPCGQALELGVGPGHDAVFLIQKGFDLIGIDISPSAIKLTRENVSLHGLFGFFQVGDIREIPVEDGWVDVAIDRGCFHTLDKTDWTATAAEIARVIKRNGLFLIKVFSDQETPGDFPHRFTKAEIESVFTPHFKILDLRDSTIEGPINPKAYSVLMKKR